MIKIMLQGRKKSDTYLATIRRQHWSAQMTMRKIIKWSFQPAQWLSSATLQNVILKNEGRVTKRKNYRSR